MSCCCRRHILPYRSHGSHRVNRKWVTYFSHVCHPVSRRHSSLATKAGDKEQGQCEWGSESLNLWVSEPFHSDRRGVTGWRHLVYQFCWNLKMMWSFLRCICVVFHFILCISIFTVQNYWWICRNTGKYEQPDEKTTTLTASLLTAAFRVDENTKMIDSRCGDFSLVSTQHKQAFVKHLWYRGLKKWFQQKLNQFLSHLTRRLTNSADLSLKQ